MFFDLVLLNHQHRGRFGEAWVAATRGITFVNRKIIIDLDISKLCVDIEKYMCSDSPKHSGRFSLRLSTMLINGTIKIHNKKAKIFLDEAFRLMTMVITPPILKMETSRHIFPTPKRTVGVRPAKRLSSEEKSTPESEVDRLLSNIKTATAIPPLPPMDEFQTQEILQRIDEITLREPVLPPSELMTVDDLGILGPPIDLELPFDQIEQQPQLSGEEIVVRKVTDIHRKRHQLPSSSSETSQGPYRITVDAMIHAPAEPAVAESIRERRPRQQPVEDIEMIEQLPAQPDVIQEVVQVKNEILPLKRPLRELQLDEVEDVEPRKKGQRKAAALCVKIKTKKVLYIDTCMRDALKLVNCDKRYSSSCRLKDANVTALLNLYFIRPDEERTILRRQSSTFDKPNSIELDPEKSKQTPHESPLERGETPTVSNIGEMLDIPQGPMITSTPLTTRQPDAPPNLHDNTVEQIVARAGARGGAVPTRTRTIVSRFGDEPQSKVPRISLEQPSTSRLSMAYSSIPHVEYVPSAEGVPENIRSSREVIIDKILQSGDEPLTLEDVAERPLTKLTIARAFSDILELNFRQMVTCVTEPDSIELKHFTKGPKLG